MKGVRRTNDEFIGILYRKGILEHFKVMSEYGNDNSRIELLHIKSNCLFSLKAGNLINGDKKILTIVSCIEKTKYFKYLIKIPNPDVEVIGDYINENVKILIQYNYEHYSVSPRNLYTKLNPRCIANSTKTDAFVRKCIRIYGDKYDYSKIIYNKWDDKIEVICKEHGSFNILASDFVSPSTLRGCQICSRGNSPSSGWKHSDWLKTSKTSKRFDGFKIYIIECYNDNERFIKIGRTFLKLNIRFENSDRMPYKYDILKIINGSSEYIYRMEGELHRKFKKYKYIPKIHFNGLQECFNVSIKDLF